MHAPSTVSAAMTLAAERCLWPTALHHFPGLGAGGPRHVSVSLRLLEDPRQAELVLATALGRVISINVFAAAGIGPVRRIGVTARVTALSPSAWEVSSVICGLPAETLICAILARLATSDRESPRGPTPSGTYGHDRAVPLGGGYVFGAWVVHGAWLAPVTLLVTCTLLW